ncbi:MAG: HD domain-containing protein [Erysipelotrichaceae bacterium]|nr:HD domain-containing protein [Erysipelotrichaceae bacterium]
MITVSEAIIKMIGNSEGSQYDICHFLKVWAYAKNIGEQEGLDERTQQTLEFAAIVHDIACPSLRREYGNSPHDLQEKYGPPMVREFYKDSGMSEEMLERICYLVGHHHTFTDVDGLDYRILLEADFLVNAGENEKYRNSVDRFRQEVFRTKTGTALLNCMYS